MIHQDHRRLIHPHTRKHNAPDAPPNNVGTLPQWIRYPFTRREHAGHAYPETHPFRVWCRVSM